MATSPCLWRTQVGRLVQHDRCPQDAAGAPLEQPLEPARRHGVRALGGSGRQPSALLPRSRMSITLAPTVTHVRCRRNSRFNRTRKGSSAARCVVEEVRHPTEDNGLCRRLLEPEAAGITTSGTFSITDEDFAREGLRFNTPDDSVDLDQLNGLFAKVGFPQRMRAKLQIALRNTLAMVWLVDTEQGKIIAFARATGDAVFNATIWDVVVDPGWQKKGLGKAVIERLMAELLNKGIVNINLYAEPNVVSFYKPLGFVTDPSGISGMAFNKKKAAF